MIEKLKPLVPYLRRYRVQLAQGGVAVLLYNCSKLAAPLLIGHGGQQGGFISHFYLNQSAKLAYLISFNTDSSDPATDTQELDRKLRDDLFAGARADQPLATRRNASWRIGPSSP